MSGVDWARHETLALRWCQGGMGMRVGLERDFAPSHGRRTGGRVEGDWTGSDNGTDNGNHLYTQHFTSQINSTHYRESKAVGRGPPVHHISCMLYVGER